MKVLISWLAHNNDFTLDDPKEKVNVAGPTYQLHKHLFEQLGCDRHIILSGSGPEDLRLAHLINKLQRDFGHDIVGDAIPLKDPIDINEIKSKVESYLLKLKADRIDLYISPGTPSMQTAWYICHSTLGLNTRLFQTRAARHTKGKDKPELVEVKVQTSSIPVTAILSQDRVDHDEEGGDYKVTASIKPVYDLARKVADTDRVNVLILGDTGTGKEHLARYIHDHSARKAQPYITVNCSAMNDQLLESRLFGFRKGAFTGAEKDTPGLFELAHHGTLFLDEIGDISPYMQQSLLRVLQEQEIQPIGGAPRKVDVRVIAATHRDLTKRCATGEFRWDLYYRMAVVELALPSLLERGASEIKMMLDHFIATEKKALRRPKKLELTREAKQALVNHTWPGNLRELQNLVRRLYVFADGPVGTELLPKTARQTEGLGSLRLVDVEKTHIAKVLELKEGNQRQTALALDIAINTLKRKIRDHRLEERTAR
jgi:transcriptional regulator of acetoin/glycerol metabolism